MHRTTLATEATPADRHPRRWRRSVSAVLATIGIAIGVVTMATPAEAWTWDSNVTVWGYAGCKTTDYSAEVPADQVWIYVYGTGEIEQTGVDWTEFYAAHLYSIPSGGSWADLWVYCAPPGETAGWRYDGAIFIDRPWVTDLDGPVDPTA